MVPRRSGGGILLVKHCTQILAEMTSLYSTCYVTQDCYGLLQSYQSMLHILHRVVSIPLFYTQAGTYLFQKVLNMVESYTISQVIFNYAFILVARACPKSSNSAYHSACLTNLKFMQWSSKDQEVKVGIVDGLVRFLGQSTYSLGKNYLIMILEDCMSTSLISNVLLRLLSSS